MAFTKSVLSNPSALNPSLPSLSVGDIVSNPADALPGQVGIVTSDGVGGKVVVAVQTAFLPPVFFSISTQWVPDAPASGSGTLTVVLLEYGVPSATARLVALSLKAPNLLAASVLAPGVVFLDLDSANAPPPSTKLIWAATDPATGTLVVQVVGSAADALDSIAYVVESPSALVASSYVLP